MKVSNAVLAVLSSARCEGNALYLVGQLDRKLYVSTNEVLEAAGGKWNKKQKAHLFSINADEAIDAVILAGEIVTAKEQQDKFGFFPTPPAIARRLVDLAEIEPGMCVLEPSAGRGAIAIACAAAGAKVDTIEIQPDNCKILKDLRRFNSVGCGDFLLSDPAAYWDRVVMNPPFAMQADIKHVMHARQFLKAGGILVSVMSAGVLFREDGRAKNFREWVQFRGGIIEPLPEGSFKASGTGVNTCVVKVSV